jgi:hypothetical protein
MEGRNDDKMAAPRAWFHVDWAATTRFAQGAVGSATVAGLFGLVTGQYFSVMQDNHDRNTAMIVAMHKEELKKRDEQIAKLHEYNQKWFWQR